MDYIKINNSDNVCVALNALKAGEKITVENESVVTNSDIPAGHKVALKDIKSGEDIIKYGNRACKGRYKGRRSCTYPQYKDGIR